MKKYYFFQLSTGLIVRTTESVSFPSSYVTELKKSAIRLGNRDADLHSGFYNVDNFVLRKEQIVCNWELSNAGWILMILKKQKK